jgi:myo-inositol 2-dehydrogenase/D-chiro-inositol 1-dehydrogenase
MAMFVEKPLGLDAEVAGQVARAVAKAGVVTAVGHHWRYSAAVRLAARLITDREVRLVCGSWLDKVPPVPWWTRRDKSGGQVLEQAVHVLDLARALVGEVQEVHAIGNGGRPGADIDCATAATLRFASGAVGTLVATCQLDWKHRAGLEVYTDKLALAITEHALIVHDSGGVRRQGVDPMRAKVAADRAFVQAVLGDPSAVLVPYEEALRTHRLACAVTTSARLSKPVAIPDD